MNKTEGRASEPTGVFRRSVLKSSVWAVPVIAVATAAPMVAASGGRVLTWGVLTGIAACETQTDATVTLVDGTGPLAGESVSVTLPAGLRWEDGAVGSKTFDTDANGIAHVSGITGTGRAGTYSLAASATDTTTVIAALTVDAQASAIWASLNAVDAIAIDGAGTVKNPVALTAAVSFVWAINAAGELYVHSSALDGPWNKVATSGTITELIASKGASYAVAIIGGDVYGLAGGVTTPELLGGLSGTPTDIAASSNIVYALMPDGTWWWRYIVGGAGWLQVTGGATAYTAIDVNEGGGFGWAIDSDGEAYWTAPATSTANPSDPTDALTDAVEIKIGATYAFARDANGDVYSHFAASSSTPWVKMTGLPVAPSNIYTNTGGDSPWALVNGRLYYGTTTQFFPADSAGVLDGDGGVADVEIATGFAYVKSGNGHWWSKPYGSDGGWKQITGVLDGEITTLGNSWGNYSFAIAPAVEACPPI